MTPQRTEVNIDKRNYNIDHQTVISMLGSCFTDNIGGRLAELKFRTDINPFGNLYNPLSVMNGLEILLDEKEYGADDLHHENGLWLSFDHHSSFSDPRPEACLEKINTRLKKAFENFKKSKVLILTFGTAWAYVLEGTNRIVSNCHKLPSERYDRFQLNNNQIFDFYLELFTRLNEKNPDLRIIMTVSPVRHRKDGPVENSLSKAILLLSIHRLVRQFDFVEYFPAFEIAIDDLRDYRYYADDLVHPNSQMSRYIWEKFCQAYFSEETLRINAEVEKIVAARNHRPFNPQSEEHQAFLKKQLELVRSLQAKHSFLDLSADERWFTQQLA